MRRAGHKGGPPCSTAREPGLGSRDTRHLNWPRVNLTYICIHDRFFSASFGEDLPPEKHSGDNESIPDVCCYLLSLFPPYLTGQRGRNLRFKTRKYGHKFLWCFWTAVLEKTLESPLDCKEIQPVHSKGDQSWVFIGRTDVEAETPILWPPHAKSWLVGKDPDAGRDWGQEEKGTTEDEMAGWHHRLYGHEFEQTPGVGDGQGGLACCDSWGHKELDTTERLNWTEPLKYRCGILASHVESLIS